uniref:Leucine rich repeat domain containing protein n=1 Tax=Palpitomonas bilix TaxID=652834 RepID=A0A7S3LX85_9EUKA
MYGRPSIVHEQEEEEGAQREDVMVAPPPDVVEKGLDVIKVFLSAFYHAKLTGVLTLRDLNLEWLSLRRYEQYVADVVEMDLTGNHLLFLPLEVGKLSHLRTLRLDGVEERRRGKNESERGKERKGKEGEETGEGSSTLSTLVEEEVEMRKKWSAPGRTSHLLPSLPSSSEEGKKGAGGRSEGGGQRRRRKSIVSLPTLLEAQSRARGGREGEWESGEGKEHGGKGEKRTLSSTLHSLPHLSASASTGQRHRSSSNASRGGEEDQSSGGGGGGEKVHHVNKTGGGGRRGSISSNSNKSGGHRHRKSSRRRRTSITSAGVDEHGGVNEEKIRECQLLFPPPAVWKRGSHSVIQFLRDRYRERVERALFLREMEIGPVLMQRLCAELVKPYLNWGRGVYVLDLAGNHLGSVPSAVIAARMRERDRQRERLQHLSVGSMRSESSLTSTSMDGSGRVSDEGGKEEGRLPLSSSSLPLSSAEVDGEVDERGQYLTSADPFLFLAASFPSLRRLNIANNGLSHLPLSLFSPLTYPDAEVERGERGREEEEEERERERGDDKDKQGAHGEQSQSQSQSHTQLDEREEKKWRWKPPPSARHAPSPFETTLVSLIAQRNQLRSVPAALAALSNLTEVDFGSNMLVKVPTALRALRKLKLLTLSDNLIEEVPPFIGSLTSLTKLWVGGNFIRFLPSELGFLSLTLLDWDDNPVVDPPVEILSKGLPITMDYFKRMERAKQTGILNLRQSGLTSLPPSVLSLTHLTQLLLSSNDIRTLPAELEEFGSLRLIEVDGNPLEDPPLEVIRDGADATRSYMRVTRTAVEKGMPSLNLAGLGLSALPRHLIFKFAEKGTLQSLDLTSNCLTALPLEIGYLTSLTELKLDGNQLTALPVQLAHLSLLTKLDTLGNAITSPPPHIMEEGPKAVREYLAYNLPYYSEDGTIARRNHPGREMAVNAHPSGAARNAGAAGGGEGLSSCAISEKRLEEEVRQLEKQLVELLDIVTE